MKLNRDNINSFIKEKKIGILLISRMQSKRLKKKASLKILKKSLFEIIIMRLLEDFHRENIFICTSNDKYKKFYSKFSKIYGLKVFYGSREIVLKRIINCMKKFKLKHFVRVTADNVLIDNNAIKKLVRNHIKNKNDYTFSNSLISGTESEVFSLKSLKYVLKNAIDKKSTEFLSYYFLRKKFKSECVKFKKMVKNENYYNISVDYKKNYILLKKLIKFYNSFFIKKSQILLFIKKYLKIEKRHSKIMLKTKNYDVRFKSDLKSNTKHFNLQT